MAKTSRHKRKEVFDLLKGKCFYCGCDLDIEDFHMDHFVPKSSGGMCRENLVPSCRDCNLFKSSFDLEEFREKIAELRHSSFHARMMCKYFNVPEQPVVFYFEEVGYGTV